MITNKDIEKLKDVFATKKDLESFVTKDDLARTTDQLVELITDGFSRVDKAIKKIANHEITLNTHERRLDTLEDKVFA